MNTKYSDMNLDGDELLIKVLHLLLFSTENLRTYQTIIRRAGVALIFGRLIPHIFMYLKPFVGTVLVRRSLLKYLNPICI